MKNRFRKLYALLLLKLYTLGVIKDVRVKGYQIVKYLDKDNVEQFLQYKLNGEIDQKLFEKPLDCDIETINFGWGFNILLSNITDKVTWVVRTDNSVYSSAYKKSALGFYIDTELLQCNAEEIRRAIIIEDFGPSIKVYYLEKYNQ